MSESMFGLIRGNRRKPTRARAEAMERIAKEEGGHAFVECNLTPNAAPGINNGAYQGWFTGPNMGQPFDSALSHRVMQRITAEIGSFF